MVIPCVHLQEYCAFIFLVQAPDHESTGKNPFSLQTQNILAAKTFVCKNQYYITKKKGNNITQQNSQSYVRYYIRYLHLTNKSSTMALDM
jgi:hypothetical protein